MFRFFDRFTGDPELAAHLARTAFHDFYQHGAWPEEPIVKLLSVSVPLLEDKRFADRFLLNTTLRDSAVMQTDKLGIPALAAQVQRTRARVRSALDALGRTERIVLLLHADGFRYQEIAAALPIDVHQLAIVLADAHATFRAEYHRPPDAS